VELATWAAAAGISEVLLLCSLDAQYRREQQLEGSQLRYLTSDNAEGAEHVQQQIGSSCTAVGLQQLEPDVIDNEKDLHGQLPPWPILQELQQSGVRHTLLSVFAAEGDNAADGMGLATAVLAVAKQAGVLQGGQQGQQEQQQPPLQVPCSWAGLMGRRTIDSTLF
jgi:proteasome assembly chaperone 2